MIAEKQTITINVLDHETPDTIITSVREWYGETNAARCEFPGQRVRIRHLQVSIPTKRRFTAVVRDRFDGDLFAVGDCAERLEHDHRPTTADNPEKLVVRRWSPECNVKTQHIAIKGEGCRDVGDNKERGDAGDRGSSHV